MFIFVSGSNSLWEKQDPWANHRQPDGRKGTVAVGRPSEMEEEDHFDNFVARESIRFLENYAHQNEPFLLVTSFLKPHDPFTPAKRFADMFQAEHMQLSPTWGKADKQHLPLEVRESIENCRWTPELKEPAGARQRMASYYACLAQADDCAGQVLSALSRLGLDRNTIVVYTSDHGEMLGDLGLWNKFQFYEGSCGVPLAIRIPGHVPAECSTPVSLISLSSTLADLCEVPPIVPMDGKSFGELVRHPGSNANHGPVFAEYNVGTADAKYMIRDGNYKYVHWVSDIAELYDLQADPQELQNLAAEKSHRSVVERLQQELFAWHTPAETARKNNA